MGVNNTGIRNVLANILVSIYPDLDRKMIMSYDKKENQLLFTGKNNWLNVVLVRVLTLVSSTGIGTYLVETYGENLLVRFIGIILIIIGFTILLLFFQFNKPWYKKTIIRFSSDQLVYSYSNNLSRTLVVPKSDIREMNVSYKFDSGCISLNIWFSRMAEPRFDFDLQSDEKEGSIFQIFGFFASEWGLGYYEIFPARKGYGRFVFKTKGNNSLDINEPYTTLKKRSLESQVEPSDEPSVIGSYIVKYQQGNVHIDYSLNANENFQARGMVFVSVIFTGIFIYFQFVKEGQELWLSILLLVFAGPMLFLGLNKLIAEHYLKYILDFSNKKILIRNIIWRWKNIAFDDIQDINFKGLIAQHKSSKTYSGTIELELKNDKSYLLMIIISDYQGLDDEIIKESIYTTGIRLSRLLSDKIGVGFQWLDFKEDE